MRYLNLIKCGVVSSLFSLLAACASESSTTGGVSISEVNTSDCKTSVSRADTRPEYYQEISEKRTTLTLIPGVTNEVVGQFTDVQDNCIIGRFHVDITRNDDELVLIIYPELDMLTDCVCLYDIGFKVKELEAGSYHLKVYHTTSKRNLDKSNMIYNGSIKIDSQRSITIPMDKR